MSVKKAQSSGLCVFNLNNSVRNSDCVQLNDQMIVCNELARMWKEIVVF
jgi:hypothetical protein